MAERLAARLKAEPALTLLRASADPHLDWLDLLWGPIFDRGAALQLVASRPELDTAALLAAGERFDALAPPEQQRLRQLILRHRLHRMAHAPHLAD